MPSDTQLTVTLTTTEREITIWSFEMTSPEQLRPAKHTDLDIRPLIPTLPTFMQYLWLSVGGPWSWGDRRTWSNEQWQGLASDDATFTKIGYHNGTPAGFCELHNADNEIEITFFGLFPQFFGRGYGGHLLTRAVEDAWAMEPDRIWVHTCSWDGPTAVANYEARGFTKFDEKTEVWQVSEAYEVCLSPQPSAIDRPA